MRPKPKSKVYNVVLEYANATTRTVQVKASSREVAERRALKHNPGAVGVKR
jgi:hypothetical protein